MPLSAWTRATITGILVALAPSPGISTGEPCTSDQQCMNGTDWRCVEAPAGIKGAPCTLDYGYNTTGECVCSSEGSHAVCVGGSYAEPTAGAKQYLVIGDSVSMGYFGTLKNNLTATGWDVFHAPGNCDNTNWGNRCLEGWLGPNASRWDVITMNWGLHDLAFPDNEHLDVDVYAHLLDEIVGQLGKLAPQATVLWVSTTPVPTNPPPDPTTGKSCVLIPGRLESNVLAYNNAALQTVKSHPDVVNGVCDLHSVVIAHCGVGYSTCDIAQCAGPHFVGNGFPMLGEAMAACVRNATSV